MRNFLLFFLLAFGNIAPAQPNGKYLIKAGSLFDSETGQFREGMTVLVNNNKIIAVKPLKELTHRYHQCEPPVELGRQDWRAESRLSGRHHRGGQGPG
ncbi:MAG TPA: hypothetical protein VG052_13515 [Puia sp.]|jgi:hypothetical protein|nr:hypothetical protein [Puia sp.]